MIVVTRLNQTRFALNPDLIERIQASPDTTIIMVDAATFVVTETMDELIAKITQYRANVLATAARLTGSNGTDTGAALAGDAEAVR